MDIPTFHETFNEVGIVQIPLALLAKEDRSAGGS